MPHFKFVGEDGDDAIVYVHPDRAGESRHAFAKGEVVEADANPDAERFVEVDAPKAEHKAVEHKAAPKVARSDG